MVSRKSIFIISDHHGRNLASNNVGAGGGKIDHEHLEL